MVDFKKVARVLVERQLRIREGEVVRISGGLHTIPLVEEIAVHIRKVGAFPLLELSWDDFARRMLEDIPERYLSASPDHWAQIESMIDCNIGLPPLSDPGILERVDPRKARLRAEALRNVQEARLKKNARKIGIGFPTPAQAKIFGISFEKYHDLFWKAVVADVDRIFDLCQKIRQRLAGDRVRIVSPEGDELHCSIRNRRINMDDGVISDEDLETGDITANLPFGEVYLAPVEETVEGVSRYPVVFYQGKTIRDLKLVFEKGRLVDSSAETNHRLFLEALSTHTGDKDRIGELGIGTNHEVLEPTGSTLLDEKIFGSIHLALGENRSYGGKNRSSCHWDMVMLAPTLFVDDALLIDKGRFVL